MYIVWGKVKRGKNRGKAFGFPTANISLHRQIPEGVYISRTKVKGAWHPSLTFIGTAKTFEETKYQAETYILQSNSLVILGSGATPESDSGQARMTFNLYDQWVSIKLLKKLRGNKKFASEKELIEQMKEDENKAREYFTLL